MADILADENVDAGLCAYLRLLGHSVTAVRSLCASKYGDGIEDSAVLSYAISHQFAVLTFNRADFRRLHHATPWHYGIILCESETDLHKQARKIHAAIVGKSLCAALVEVLAHVPKPRRPRKRRGGKTR